MRVDVVAELVASVVRTVRAPGETVRAGDALLLVESMKMEIPVQAPVDGQVAAVHVEAGDIVSEGDLLVEIDPA